MLCANIWRLAQLSPSTALATRRFAAQILKRNLNFSRDELLAPKKWFIREQIRWLNVSLFFSDEQLAACSALQLLRLSVNKHNRDWWLRVSPISIWMAQQDERENCKRFSTLFNSFSPRRPLRELNLTLESAWQFSGCEAFNGKDTTIERV